MNTIKLAIVVIVLLIKGKKNDTFIYFLANELFVFLKYDILSSNLLFALTN